jgi:hypothetical protein
MRDTSRRLDVDVYLKMALAAIGGVLLVSSFLLGYTGFTDTYRHDVTPAAELDQESTPEAVLTDLSPHEQSVVLDSLTSTESVWRGDPVGLRFSYPPEPQSARYTVEFENTRYVLETATVQRPITMLIHALQVSFGAAGLLLLVAGGVPLVWNASYPNTPLSEPFRTVLQTWMPIWAGLVIAPAAVFALVYPIMLETVWSLPFNLFVTPFLLATSLCTLLSMGVVRTIELSDSQYLLSTLNASFLWAVAVGLYVSPASGETSATLTLFLYVSSLSVLVGVSLGWYTQRMREVKESDYPSEPAYWKI